MKRILNLITFLFLCSQVADSQPAIEQAPTGFDVEKTGIERRNIETVEYESVTVGTTRKVTIYTPLKYSAENKYPVLYLLHGIGGDETEWLKNGNSQVILDNLYADGKLEPVRKPFSLMRKRCGRRTWKQYHAEIKDH